MRPNRRTERTERARPGLRLAGTLASTLLLGWLLALAPPMSPAGAAAAPCPCRAGSGQSTCMDSHGRIHLCNREEDPGDTTTTGPQDPNDPEDPGPQTWCPPRQWITLGGYDSVPPHIRPSSWDEAPPGAIFQYDRCTCPASVSYCPGGTTRWYMPGAEPEMAPLPEDVAEDAWAEIEATLEPPAVVTHPPDGEPSRVRQPTFVAVSNWEGPIEEEACDPTGVVCVVITAEPTLTWAPAEPRDLQGRRWSPGVSLVAPITCEDGGTTPTAGSVGEQADASGACAHRFRYRTDVEGRPATWDGVVTITWETAWETSAGPTEDSGTFGDVTQSTDLPLEVVDVSTVVVDDLRRGGP